MTYKGSQIKENYWLLLLLVSMGLSIGVISTSFKAEKQASETIKENSLQELEVLQQQAKQLTHTIEFLEQKQIPLSQVQNQFYQVKNNYKKLEYLIESLDPELAKSMNGAPIPKVVVEDGDYQTIPFLPPSSRTFPPEGLQVLEELLFADVVNHQMQNEALVQAISLEEKVLLFTNNLKNQALSDRQILESLREEMIRVMTMGISGFDAPAAGKELDFVITSLQPLLVATQLYENSSNKAAQRYSREATLLLEKGIQYLEEHPNFETFNRLFFTKEIADPAYGALTDLQHAFIPLSPTISRPVNQNARSLFDQGFLQPAYYAKQDRNAQSPELLELGRMLFFDPALSANNQRSCASCHNPSKAFTDGAPRSLAFDFKGTVLRNSPTLLNAVFSNAYFYDSRSQYLQDQVPEVVLKIDELHSSYEEVVEKIQYSKEYKKMFRKAFKGQMEDPVSVNSINRAIAAYVQSLVALNSPFDRYMRGESGLLDDSAKRGYNLFMGKAACGTCHFAPIFNGTMPPRFMESESEVLGVPESADFAHARLDKDLGKAGIIPEDAWRHSFKTPTIRNVALTAPYMHNGALASLEEVIEFYDLGGGIGLGLEVPNQTLPADALELSEQEKKDIISFMESLSDTTTNFTAPEQLPRFSAEKADLNNREVGGIY